MVSVEDDKDLSTASHLPSISAANCGDRLFVYKENVDCCEVKIYPLTPHPVRSASSMHASSHLACLKTSLENQFTGLVR